jgi:hypothetical protein
MEISRIPRRLKKELKKKYKHRYGCDWLKCDDIIEQYIWFYHNPFNWDMNKQLWKLRI